MSHERYRFHVGLGGRSTSKGWLSGVRWWITGTKKLRKVTLCKGCRTTCGKYNLHFIPLEALDPNTMSVERMSKFLIQMKMTTSIHRYTRQILGLIWGTLDFLHVLWLSSLATAQLLPGGRCEGSPLAATAVLGSSNGLRELYLLLNSLNSSLER